MTHFIFLQGLKVWINTNHIIVMAVRERDSGEAELTLKTIDNVVFTETFESLSLADQRLGAILQSIKQNSK